MRLKRFIGSGCMALAGALLLAGCGKEAPAKAETKAREVLVLSGGTMRAVVEAAAARYRAESGDSVVITYGDSAEMCAQLRNTGRGDIYICHDPFMPWAEKQGLIAGWKPVAYLDNVLVVPKGNPKGIQSVQDLAKPGLRVGVGDRRYSTSGVMVKQMLAAVDAGGGSTAILSPNRAGTRNGARRWRWGNWMPPLYGRRRPCCRQASWILSNCLPAAWIR